MLTSKPLLLAGAAVLALAACEPMTEDNRRTQTGAVTGAAIGGLIGATSNSSTRPLATLAGAAVGAASAVRSVRNSTRRRANCAATWATMSMSSIPATN
jgi:outer membrane lipoprotein SlyB